MLDSEMTERSTRAVLQKLRPPPHAELRSAGQPRAAVPTWLSAGELSRLHKHWSGDSPENQSRIFRTKGNAVTHRVFNLCIAPRDRHIVEVTDGIRVLEVDGGRNLVALHSHNGCGASGRAASALRVADLRLERRHGDIASALAQGEFQCLRLDAII